MDALRTMTPWRRTSSGSRGTAACTRLLTLIAARSGSEPIANVTLIISVPSPELTDCMYSMFSTPLISFSSGAATVSAMVSAVAPG